MADLLSDEEAAGKVREIYDEIRANLGMIPNFFRAQAAANPEWLELNWLRWKNIMGYEGSLDRKTKELIAVAVSLTNNSKYCAQAHEAMALMIGASTDDIIETKKVVELFASYNKIAESLDIPCDILPDMVKGRKG
jgi:AhpD family alkylhydroperoxidase